MPNWIDSFLAPNYAGYKTEQEAEWRKVQSTGNAMQRLRDMLDREQLQGINDAIETLGRENKLNGTTLANAVGLIGQAKITQLAGAQMQADASREAARLRATQLGDYANAALTGDIVSGVAKVGAIALGAYAAGAPLAAAATAGNAALGVAPTAAKAGWSLGQKMAVSGIADALGNTGGSYLGLAKEQAMQPGTDAANQQSEFDKQRQMYLQGFDWQEFWDWQKKQKQYGTQPGEVGVGKTGGVVDMRSANNMANRWRW